MGAFAEKFVEVFEGGKGDERVGLQNVGLVAGFGADEGSCLEAALEGTGDDAIELRVEGVEDKGELQAVALALLVERTFYVQGGIGAADACAGVTKDK